MDRTQKQEAIAWFNGTLREAGVVVVTHNVGLSVAEMTDLRTKMREAGAGFKVMKNRLALRAIEGTPFGGLAKMFTGPTAVAYSRDPVAAAKVAVSFGKTNPKLVLVGGGLGGTVLDAEGIKALASLPSLEELRGRLLGAINAPAARLAGVLRAPGGQLARVLRAYAEGQGNG